MCGIDGIEKGTVRTVEFLIPAPAGPSVVDGVGRVSVKVRITGIYPSEVGEQRDQASVTVIDPVSYAVDRRDVRPGKNIAWLCVFRRLYAGYHSTKKNVDSVLTT